MRFALASLMLMLLSLPATASACRDIDPANDTDGSSCAAQDLAKADAELNQVYKALLAEMDAAALTNPDARLAKQHLVDAQRAWVTLRDGDCGAVFSYYQSGTIRVGLELDCKLQRTRERTEQLRHLIDG